MTELNRVGIYCRLSKEDEDKISKDDDSNSIQNQKNMLTTYAVEHGWEIYNIYSDDDYSGSDRLRPQFNQLLEDAKNHKFNIILCKSQSRFTREAELVEKYIHGLLPIWGVRFIGVVDNADTDVKGNKKARQINGLVNEWYLEDMSENIRSVLDSRRKDGHHIGSFALYGYMKDPNKKGHLIIDKEAAEIVREIFDMYYNGYSKASIAKMLNSRNVPTPSTYKRMKGINFYNPHKYKKTLWMITTVTYILRNQMYVGDMVQGKIKKVSYKSDKTMRTNKDDWIIIKNTHEAIIDRDKFNKIQEMQDAKIRPCKDGKTTLFSGKMRCMNCGRPLRFNVRENPKKTYRYYRCQSKFVSDDICVGSTINIETLKTIVLNEIRELSKAYLDSETLNKEVKLNNDLKQKLNQLKDNICIYNNKLSDLQNGLRELYIDKVKKIISEDDYISFSIGFKNDIKEYEKLIEETESKISHINEQINQHSNKNKIISQYVDIKELNREIVNELIDTIYVGKKDKITKQAPVKIHWNF